MHFHYYGIMHGFFFFLHAYSKQVFKFGKIPPKGRTTITIFVLFSLLYHRKVHEIMHLIEKKILYVFGYGQQVFLQFSYNFPEEDAVIAICIDFSFSYCILVFDFYTSELAILKQLMYNKIMKNVSFIKYYIWD